LRALLKHSIGVYNIEQDVKEEIEQGGVSKAHDQIDPIALLKSKKRPSSSRSTSKKPSGIPEKQESMGYALC
jgi:hypothetical protein